MCILSPLGSIQILEILLVNIENWFGMCTFWPRATMFVNRVYPGKSPKTCFLSPGKQCFNVCTNPGYSKCLQGDSPYETLAMYSSRLINLQQATLVGSGNFPVAAGKFIGPWDKSSTTCLLTSRHVSSHWRTVSTRVPFCGIPHLEYSAIKLFG